MISGHLLEAVVVVLARRWAPPPEPPSLHEFAASFTWTEGLCAGQQVVPERHPAQWHVLHQIGEALAGRSHFRRFVIVKPAQDGGTWIIVCFVLLYVATQLRRPVAVGFPDMRLASIAWREKIRKPIEKAGHAAWLPAEGLGSEGSSAPPEVALNNTPCYFMGGGASNEAGQAGLTAFLLIRDERDAMERYVAELMGGRLDGYDESGISIDLSTIKHDEESAHLANYQESTAFRFAYPCPRCGGYQTMEDEQLVYDGATEKSAEQTARLRCKYSDCGHLITDAERVGGGDVIGMIDLRHTVIVGRGQTLNRDGTVSGQAADTLACGIMWVSLDSPQKSLRKLASERWQAEKDKSRGDHEKMRRYMRDRCCRVYLGDRADGADLDARQLAERSAQARFAAGLVPPEASFLTAMVDVQLRELWYQVMAHARDGRWWIVASGRVAVGKDFREIPSALELRESLEKINDMLADGYPVAGADDGRRMPVTGKGADVRYQARIVMDWIAEQAGEWIALRGAGDGELSDRPRGERLERIEGYVDVRVVDGRLIYYVEVDALKHSTIAALRRPVETPEAGHLPKGEAADGWLPKQLSAERFVKGKWVKIRRDNHQFDLANYNRGYGRYLGGHGGFTSADDQADGGDGGLVAALGQLMHHERRF